MLQVRCVKLNDEDKWGIFFGKWCVDSTAYDTQDEAEAVRDAILMQCNWEVVATIAYGIANMVLNDKTDKK